MINKFVEKIMEKTMKKETELIRVPKSIKQDRFTFYIEDENIILNSIEVWGIKLNLTMKMNFAYKYICPLLKRYGFALMI